MLTCLAKLVSLAGSAAVLKLPDALFGIQNRWVMLVAALVEAFVPGVLLSNAAALRKLLHIRFTQVTIICCG